MPIFQKSQANGHRSPGRCLALLGNGVTFVLILARLLARRRGREYGMTGPRKLMLVYRMFRNTRRIEAASGFLEHLVMVCAILDVPRDRNGVIVECGSFKGASTANLSLVASVCGRQLHVFDSFQGLPEPGIEDREHLVIGSQEIHAYRSGDWSGSLDEVQANIGRGGEIESCHFHPGWFEETLPKFTKHCVFVFIDVDLVSSLQSCLLGLWPLLHEGSAIFTHEAHHAEIGALFFDRDWWQTNFNDDAPGLVGVGTGLGLYPTTMGFVSSLGFTIKHPCIEALARVEYDPYD